MHPTVIADKPGSCPVCGMDLVRKARPGEEVKITEELGRLTKSTNEVVIANIKTIKGEFKSMSTSIEATGLVTYDTRYIYSIPSRVAGRLERVYLKYAFQPVRKGQKVADIYSPDLVTAQRELLYLTENDSKNTALIEAAKNKLYLLGVTLSQVDAIVKNKEVAYTFSIFSPYEGFIISPTAQPPVVSSSVKKDMTSNISAKSRELSELIREGNYVSAGETLFKVANASALRLELNLPVAQSGNVKLNDLMQLDFGASEFVNAKVDFVQPFFNEDEEFIKVRVYAKDKDLRIGQLVRASILRKIPETLWLPKQAVLDLGLERTVFVKERGLFKPRKVVTGIRADQWIEIKQGLSSADEVAENAQYLVDSDSFIKSKQ